MKTLKKALKKIVTSIFILVSILFLIIGANAMGFFKKEDKKEYREYKLSSYLGVSWLIPIQTSIALMLQQHPELESTSVENITPLPQMMDPRGENYQTDPKAGPYIYFRSLQNIPLNFFNAIQVLGNGGGLKSLEGCERSELDRLFYLLVKDGKGCVLLDVHEFVLTQPKILEAIRSGILHPKKYMTEKNKKIWVNYVYKTIELSGGLNLLSHTNYHQHIQNNEYDNENVKEHLEQDYKFALSTKIQEGIQLSGHPPKTIQLLYIIRFLNNEGKVTHIEYFEPYLTQGE